MPCIYQHDFFISYPNMSTENIVTEFAEELVKAIEHQRTGERLPMPVYMDKARLEPGFRWKPELSRALCHSRAMLAVYTDDYFSSVYCLGEWDAMVDLELKRLGKPVHSMIIPILLRASEDDYKKPILPERMKELQYEDFRSILAPKQQFKNIKVLEKVQRLLKRINDLRKQSQNPKVDCDTYEVMIPAAALPPPQEAFGGGWAS
ncbi:MAG: toll/interleukin-1 receptor domain-containing protein [Acidobacteria bacterium]|nr:toll/interleukin-1 receptor domain-containing protein [Acidobacteriota bacterium]